MRIVFLEFIKVGVKLKFGRKEVSKMIVLFLGLSLIMIGWNTSVVSNGSSTIKNPLLNDLTPIAKIIIASDEDFGPSGYNFPGDGTIGNPYLIENYNVSSTGPYGILIESGEGFLPFNVSFVIRDCIVSAQEVCIKIVNVYPNFVKIENCVCSGETTDQEIGIQLERCDGAIVRGNTCIDGQSTSIRLDLSSGVLIENNTCHNNGAGIRLDNMSNDNILRLNTITTSISGIYIENSHNNQLKYNIVNDNIFGIYLTSSVLTEITNSNISFNGDAGIEGVGVVVSDSDNSVIKYNNFESNSAQAIAISPNSDNCLVHHNNFIQNGLLWGFVQCIEGTDAEHIYARWYDIRTLEGNWWDDSNSTKPYLIGGTAGNTDPFPLSSMVPIETYATTELHYNLTYFILALSLCCLAIIMIRKKTNLL
jgi:parallel beta-helix repeat protein